MYQYLILAQSETTAHALNIWLDFLGNGRLPDDDPGLLVWERSVRSNMASVEAFETLSGFIENATQGKDGMPLDKIIVLVDAVNPAGLNAIAEYGWDHVVAMLILAFPEIRWVFGSIKEGEAEFPVCDHDLPSLLLQPWREPLFDPTRIRDFVRSKTGKTDKEKDEKKTAGKLLPRRLKLAAAIDEEVSYVLFHAYTAYRFGYSAEAVQSWGLMKYLFNGEGSHNFDLLLEDVNLSFPDKPGGVQLSDFENKRAYYCSRLSYSPENRKESSTARIIITGGYSGEESLKIEKNLKFLVDKKGESNCGLVLKPGGGMFDLWHKTKLISRLDFEWPSVNRVTGEGGHSAPGKLMLIAQHLIRRGDALRGSANTTDECIHGAVLMTDALEFLGYQTPMLALQALEVKHEFEVKAEVSFIGVGNTFDVKSRFCELEKNVIAASKYFGKSRYKAVKYDSLVSILSRIMLVFRETGLQDEEQICLGKIRHYHRRLKFITIFQGEEPIFSGEICNPQRRLKFFKTVNLFDLASCVAVGYIEWLISSPIYFFLALMIWFSIFNYSFYSLGCLPDNAFYHSSMAFIGGELCQVGGKITFAEMILSFVAAGVGFFHLGVFISYIYSVITGK